MSSSTVTWDGMELEAPETRPMVGVYRSGSLIGLFNTTMQAEKAMNAACSLRMVEENGFKMRCVPLTVTLDLREGKEEIMAVHGTWRRSDDPIFNDIIPLFEALRDATDYDSFREGYILGYNRGYAKAWHNRKDEANG